MAEPREDLNSAVRDYAKALADQIQAFVKDMATLEVRTFTTPEDQIQVLVKTKSIDDIINEGNVVLRAGTSISFDGDFTQLTPLDANGAVNAGLWELHQQAVQQATQHRERMLKALGEAAESTLRALRAANG
jgi:hypothetical protein